MPVRLLKKKGRTESYDPSFFSGTFSFSFLWYILWSDTGSSFTGHLDWGRQIII